MDPWIGPAIVAAVVSGVVSAAGWFVTSWQAMRLEQRRRREKVRDYQIALEAEITSDLLNMVVLDRAELLEQIAAQHHSDPRFSVVVPHMATNVIFNEIVRAIHILPGKVITPVVNYARLRQTLERFAQDMRTDRFRELTAERHSRCMAIISRRSVVGGAGADGGCGLGHLLQLSIQDGDRLSPQSASAPAGAPGRDEGGAGERDER